MANGEKESKSAAEKSDKRKQSLYFPEDMLEEIQKEAMRQDRSLSWIVQKAWKIAREQIRKFPSVNDVVDENEKDDERELNPTPSRERPDRT
jgi:uncharacterized small protein (TIGR04563 family)